MEFFKPNTKFDFMGQRKAAAVFSVILVIASLIALLWNGLNLGLDFTGGTQIELRYQQSADIDNIRTKIVKVGFRQAIVQPYGSTHDVLIRIGPQKGLKQQELKQKILAALPSASIEQMQYIGPQVGKTLVTNGVLAILVSLLATMLYIAIRFEYRFAVSAAVALLHDPIVTLGIFALFHVEFNLIGLAAILTIIGYSLNDTIVVYDRVRENFRKIRKSDAVEIMNVSINQTLSRTIMTSGLTLLVVLALLVFGGEVLFSFSLALMIGIVVGTYSSIYVAGSLAIVMGLDRTHLIPAQKQLHDDRP